METQLPENKSVTDSKDSETLKDDELIRWYVLRDLKRPNSKTPNWQMLRDHGFEVFTPMKVAMTQTRKKKVRVEVPAIPDLLFAHSSERDLGQIISVTETLQFRFLPGGYRKLMVVPDDEMDRFMRAVKSSSSIEYLQPGEITPSMVGKRVRIVGGALNGLEVQLLKIRGTRKKKAIVEIPNLVAAVVEIDLTPDEPGD